MAVEKKKPEAPMSDKKKALETAISQIEKNFGNLSSAPLLSVRPPCLPG